MPLWTCPEPTTSTVVLSWCFPHADGTPDPDARIRVALSRSAAGWSDPYADDDQPWAAHMASQGPHIGWWGPDDPSLPWGDG